MSKKDMFSHVLSSHIQLAYIIGLLTLSLPRVINFNFLLQSPTRGISKSLENLAFDTLLK